MRGPHKGFFVIWLFFFTLFLFATSGYAQSHTITATAGSGGTITPSGAVPVADGANQSFTITPDPDYDVLDVYVDSVPQGPLPSYTFLNVTADHTITAAFDCLDPVMLDWDAGTYYGFVMDAYDYAVNTLGLSDFTIRLVGGSLAAEDLLFDADVLVRLEGGYDCSFLGNSLVTAIPGSVTVTAGTLIPSNIGLSGPPPCLPGDANNFPGNPEICDGLDNNCNGLVDDGLTFDDDNDGSTAIGSCGGSADDCDDNDPNNFPGNSEICDGQDNNCDTQIDEGLTAVDADGDGYTAIGSCGSADDCNDNNSGIHPDAVEIPHDGIDQDCSGADLIFAEANICSDCHGPAGSWNNLHNSVAAPDGTCTACHPVPVSNVLPGHYGRTVRTAGNNMTAGATIVCTSCHDWHDPAEYDVGNVNIVWAKVTAAGPNVTCDTCHEDRVAVHTHHSGVDNDVSYNAAVDKSQQGGCANCHHDYDNANGTTLGLSTWQTILVEHDLDGPKDGSTDTCYNCHAYDGTKSAPLAAVQNAISSGNPATCITCHTDKENADHGVPTSGKHPEHLALTGVSCGTCHDTGSYPYFKSGMESNGDGLYDLSETDVCDACHQDGTGTPTPGIKGGWYDPGYVLDCSSCHGVAPATASHPVHLSLTGCGSCHDGTVADATPPDQHLDGNIDVYDTVAGDLGYPADKEIGSGYAACSALYCHGNYNGSGRNASVVWGDPPTGACGTCHGASNDDPPGEPFTLQDGAHVRHTYSGEDWSWKTWPRNLECTLCHQGIVEGNGPDSYSVLDQNKHVNTTVDWQFDPNDIRVTGGSYSVASGTQPPTDGTLPRPYGTCNNIYCHSDVQPDGGVGGPTAYDSMEWGDPSGSFNYCEGCHNQGGSYHAIGISTGSHEKHVRSYYFGMSLTNPWTVKKCTVCHKWNPAADRTSCAQQCHDTFERVYHANGSIDILFDDFAAASGNYSGSPAPGDEYGACNNTYCHSDGTSVSTGAIPANTTPDWGTGNITCDACHAGPPAYVNGTPKANSHQVHNRYTCDVCHASTTLTGDTISNTENHVNQNYDLLAGNGTSFDYIFDSAGGTCSNISCHSGNSAVWGIPLVGGCSACHGNPPDYPNGSPKINSHSKHNQYNYNCAECHYDTTNDGLTITGPGLHVNGVMDVTFSDPTMNYDPGSNTCSNTYCHSNGMAVEGMTPESTSVQTPAPIYERTIQPNTSPAWGGAPLSCISCHDVMDDLDIYPNVLAGGPGYPDSYPDLQYKATSHGGHQFLGCNVCHYNTTNDGITISDTASHVNRVYDLDPDPGQVTTIGYAYDVGGGSCAAVCHGGFNYHNGNTWRWGYNTLGASGSGYYVGSSLQVTKNLLRSSSYGEIEGPYAFYIDWGDGTSETVMGNGAWQQGSWAWHQYGTSGSKTMNIWIRDSRNHLSLRPGTSTFSLNGMCPSGDDPGVTYDNTRVVPDRDYEINGSTVTITDLSVDPDYFCNRPSNYAGDFGLVTIDWGDGTVETFEVHLTQDPNEDQVPWGKTKVFSHTYSVPFSGIINYGVEDNVHYNGGNSYPLMPMDIPDVNVPQ